MEITVTVRLRHMRKVHFFVSFLPHDGLDELDGGLHLRSRRSFCLCLLSLGLRLLSFAFLILCTDLFLIVLDQFVLVCQQFLQTKYGFSRLRHL